MTFYQFLFLAVIMAASGVGIHLLNKTRFSSKEEPTKLIGVLVPFIVLAIAFIVCGFVIIHQTTIKLYSLYVYVGTL